MKFCIAFAFIALVAFACVQAEEAPGGYIELNSNKMKKKNN